MNDISYLYSLSNSLSKLIRYYILKMSTQAGSGHPTSSLSATDLMTALFFGGTYRFDFAHPDDLVNDRLIFSKGHATPLFYALFAAAGAIKPEELDTYRQFTSRLEGHPTARFPYAEAATGSLGQGLSVGVGLAMALRRLTSKSPKSLKLLKEKNYLLSRSPMVFVLLGDGELAEGAVWEAINLASYYKLSNLVAIVDVNRLGQSQETMLGWDTKTYAKRFQAFGWETVVVDGHNFPQIINAFKKIKSRKNLYPNYQLPITNYPPFAIIAKTVKGKGVSFLENQENWHGKPLTKEQFEQAVKELGEVDLAMRGKVGKPAVLGSFSPKLPRLLKSPKTSYKIGEMIATRKAYGTALAKYGEIYPQLVSLDGDVKNSTYSEIFKNKYPGRFFEMFIAEQNMVGAAVGFSRLGFIPFVSTFSAFLTRGFDQIRMSAIGGANIKFCGSHAGVSIGEDGPSQMGLEDIAMFRAVHGSVVLYPADAVSCEKIVGQMIQHQGITYLRTSRPPTPVIYENSEEFPIGGCKIHRLPPKSLKLLKSLKQKVLIIAAGVTLFEALKAQKQLAQEKIEAVVVDCYCVKPMDEKTLHNLTKRGSTSLKTDGTSHIIVVEDHWFDGGLGDAVLNVFSTEPKVKVFKLAVSQMPRSGKPEKLMDFTKISAQAIIEKVKQIFG